MKSIFTFIVMLPKMDQIHSETITKIVMKLILPLAVLSVTFVWYCRIVVGLEKYLNALQTKLETRNPRRGNQSRFPVPVGFLLWSSMFPFNDLI